MRDGVSQLRHSACECSLYRHQMRITHNTLTSPNGSFRVSTRHNHRASSPHDMKWWPNRQKQRTAQQAQRASHDEPTHQEATKMRGPLAGDDRTTTDNLWPRLATPSDSVNQLLRPFAVLESPLRGVRPHRVALSHSLYKSDTYVKAMPDHKQTNSATG